MSNPYAPKRAKTLTEVGDPMESFIGRLTRMGAPDDVIANVREHWNDVEDPRDLRDRDAMIALSDADLREAIREVEDEWVANTNTEDEQADIERAAVLAHLGQAHEIVNEPIAAVRGWIGDNRARAVAAWIAEHDASHDNRKGIVEFIESIAGDWLDRADVRATA